ncbi:hypothetical protein D187_002643 [Cystobacter fuscus DSM 2262]|uniref:Uncharacterized protein n=2 Tax=Cystobacter fuscus TaxID=43 RepID=S9QEY5_CYSF2|nr:hypothetical protein D187_002643 [Cystobacter fuscus DSM 2262]
MKMEKSEKGEWMTMMSQGVRTGVMLVSLAVVPTALASGGKGMTWAKVSHASGIDQVGCWGCDAYVGETDCRTALPLLCIHQDGAPTPSGLTGYYPYWAGGNIATTLLVPGQALTSLAAANQLCVNFFGTGWRMAEFHDGWGWGFHAYGNVRGDMRFWVYIDDTQGNCWNP